MSLGRHLTTAWDELKARMTKGLVVTSLVSICAIVTLNIVSAFIGGNGAFSVAYMILSTLSTSVFAACIVSFMFDIKNIRELIVRNDSELLLKMMLNTNELFSTDGSSGSSHKKILEDIRLKATAALNRIRLDESFPSESSAEMRTGHVQACLASLDHELDKAYAKYVKITRDITNEGKGVFRVDETTYVRYMNDTEAPKKIRAWNFLRSATLPDTYDNPKKNVLTERVSVTINDEIPKIYSYEQECEVVGIQGIDTKSRRWKCPWEDGLKDVCVPANGTCAVEMKREFYIPAREEISYRWETIRSEFIYEVIYHGTDCKPSIHIVNCNQCEDGSGNECSTCDKRDDRRIIPEGNTTMAILKNWPNTGIVIKVIWL